MAVTRKPTDYLPGYDADTTSITIPLASLDGVTAAEADETTGDFFEVLRGLLSAVYAKYAAMEDRSTRMAVDKSSYLNASEHVVQTFTVQFDLTAGSLNVTSEPA